MFFRKIGVFTQKLPFAKDFEITLLLCEPLPFHPQGSDHVLSKDWHTPDEQTHIPEVTTLWIRIILHSLFPSVCFSWLVYFSMNEKIFTSFYISRNYVVWSTAFPVWDHALLSGGSFQPVCFQSISFELLLFLKISYFFPHSPFYKNLVQRVPDNSTILNNSTPFNLSTQTCLLFSWLRNLSPLFVSNIWHNILRIFCT